ncbi:MAG: ISL3 family transposase [Burkholderiales bacterium]
MRIKMLLRQLLGLEHTRVVGCSFADDGLMLDVAPTWRKPRCSGCGHGCRGYDRQRGRRWRHLDLAGMKFHLRYDTRRVDCPRCGVTVEYLPWADVGSWFTRPFEDHAGYLAQRCDKTTVRKLMRVAWTTVGDIIERVVKRHQRGDLLDGLTHIGVDELSYRRHHEYVTVVVDHLAGRIVWAHKGKNADTLKAFFAELGTDRVAKLEAVTIDMSAAYIKAVTEASPQAQIIFDRFHVQRLAQVALDEVRRAEVREAPTTDDRNALKKTRWPLLKRAWNLKDLEVCKLATLTRANRRLFRAYLLKESLAAILDGKQVHVARRKLGEWVGWAFRSQLAPFRRLAATIRDHLDGILAYVRSRLSNARTEALNGKARTITRRAYGLHSASALIALLKLCCSGMDLEPVTLRPGSTH